MRIVAVDWSGSVAARGRTRWVAEVSEDGEPVFLECGRTANALGALLIEWATAQPDMVVGLDFAFSMPLWFLRERGYASAPELWRDAATNAAAWLTECPTPFWGRPPQRTRPALPPECGWFRTTELLSGVAGISPKSVFQLGGAGAVGTGSLRGMALLARLHEHGFSVWPFDPPGMPCVVEIYPRALTGAVHKSQAQARRDYLDERDWPRDPQMRTRAASTEDAFDAAVSAHEMWRHREQLRALPEAHDDTTCLEGAIWLPR